MPGATEIENKLNKLIVGIGALPEVVKPISLKISEETTTLKLRFRRIRDQNYEIYPGLRVSDL